MRALQANHFVTRSIDTADAWTCYCWKKDAVAIAGTCEMKVKSVPPPGNLLVQYLCAHTFPTRTPWTTTAPDSNVRCCPLQSPFSSYFVAVLAYFWHLRIIIRYGIIMILHLIADIYRGQPHFDMTLSNPFQLHVLIYTWLFRMVLFETPHVTTLVSNFKFNEMRWSDIVPHSARHCSNLRLPTKGASDEMPVIMFTSERMNHVCLESASPSYHHRNHLTSLVCLVVCFGFTKETDAV